MAKEYLTKGLPDWHLKINSNIDDDNLYYTESTGYGIISGLAVSAQTIPDMTVKVASGIVHMQNGIRLAPAEVNSITVIASEINPRIDIVYVKADSTIGYTKGEAVVSPIAPTLPIGAFLLSQISVSANATIITSANITDKRRIKNKTDELATQLSELENNKANLVTTPQVTVANITYYVNTTTGLDANSGLTSGMAFKTITKAIGLIPQIVNHTISIIVASGTYTEFVYFNGFVGKGKINITGGTSYSDSANYIINQIIVANTFIPITATGFQATISTTYSSGFDGQNCQYFIVDKCSCISNGTSTNARGVSSKRGGYVYVSNSQFSNRAYAEYTEDSGRLQSLNNIGTSNTNGLGAYSGGGIYKAGTQPTGITAEATGDGGVIR